MIDDLKGSAIYIPVIFAVLCGVGFAFCWKWMQAAIGDAVKPLQAQIDVLKGQVGRLENGKAKASRFMFLAQEAFPQTDENRKGREYLHQANDALNGVSESHE